MASNTRSTAIFNYGADTFFAVAQDTVHAVLIYKYDENGFVHFHNISSEGVAHVSSFKVGFKTYLAVSGYRAGIHQITKRGVYQERIDGDHKRFKDVDLWLPIPIKTYR